MRTVADTTPGHCTVCGNDDDWAIDSGVIYCMHCDTDWDPNGKPVEDILCRYCGGKGDERWFQTHEHENPF